ncbi:MAG: glutamine synthetase III, partial [Defluviitaleaceae bacterium]|nr:glutamine synthetase III [Defluviitaleaceae bacterium]
MKDISSNFGSMVFNGAVMKAKLPASVYKALRETMRKGRTLDPATASTVAAAMKDWAIEKGATHFTHWFQPMTGITAEKHESFIERDGTDRAIMAFSGKNLIQGEPDASSFPSGGLRCTFEARGYTVWDTTSYAFIKDGVLCIPTAFCSYNGEALDMKTPLLRSMEALNTQALRVLRHLGSDAQRVTANVGAEQEYFLIDKEMFLKRPDLINCGRTLFGAPPPKGQETYDHYFGSLNPRVSAFMKEVDEELWKLGVYAKTRHNEVAPCQHELAVIFTTSNIATDHNQLVMETLKATANRHNLACLLHEKPFAGVNGSGKHNNWSLSTDTGENLLEPKDDAKFLLFLVAVIKAVDEYQDLLRVSCASAGNDHRLGGHEAPPAIMSIYLGDELTSILENEGKSTPADFCALPNALPAFKRDNTDRNRTSPFAFTGNKFEFRMLGSSFSVAGSNIVLNTAVADALCQLADALDGGKDCAALIKETFEAHKRIIFNGDNYSKEWAAEAARRGLSNLKTTPEAISQLIAEKNVTLYESHGVFTKAELNSRHDIRMEA